MGINKMAGVPNKPPNKSDKTVVGSKVAAETGMEDVDTEDTDKGSTRNVVVVVVVGMDEWWYRCCCRAGDVMGTNPKDNCNKEATTRTRQKRFLETVNMMKRANI